MHDKHNIICLRTKKQRQEESSQPTAPLGTEADARSLHPMARSSIHRSRSECTVSVVSRVRGLSTSLAQFAQFRPFHIKPAFGRTTYTILVESLYCIPWGHFLSLSFRALSHPSRPRFSALPQGLTVDRRLSCLSVLNKQRCRRRLTTRICVLGKSPCQDPVLTAGGAFSQQGMAAAGL
jgi:hypothetical protein